VWQTKTAMQDLHNAAKVDESSGLDGTPQNSDFEVNMIIKEIESEILLQVRVSKKHPNSRKACAPRAIVHIACEVIVCYAYQLVTYTGGNRQIPAKNTAGETIGAIGQISCTNNTPGGNKRLVLW